MQQDNEYYIIESKEDFAGWEILLVQQWKVGVKQVHMRKVDSSGYGTFMIVYFREEFLPEVDHAPD